MGVEPPRPLMRTPLYKTGIKKLQEKCNKCTEILGDYAEKNKLVTVVISCFFIYTARNFWDNPHAVLAFIAASLKGLRSPATRFETRDAGIPPSISFETTVAVAARAMLLHHISAVARARLHRFMAS